MIEGWLHTATKHTTERERRGEGGGKEEREEGARRKEAVVRPAGRKGKGWTGEEEEDEPNCLLWN